jgi:hypothetical protein
MKGPFRQVSFKVRAEYIDSIIPSFYPGQKDRMIVDIDFPHCPFAEVIDTCRFGIFAHGKYSLSEGIDLLNYITIPTLTDKLYRSRGVVPLFGPLTGKGG